jgi:hypothetical protein
VIEAVAPGLPRVLGGISADGQPKPAAERLFPWATTGVGVCEWVYWREQVRLARLADFADFCLAVVQRYGTVCAGDSLLLT